MSPEMASNSYSHERKHVRVTLGKELLFKLPQRADYLNGMVRDLSAGGAYVTFPKKLSTGTDLLLFLKLQLRRKTALCIVSGKIVRHGGLDETAGFAIAFAPDISASSKKMLLEYIRLNAR